MNIKFGVFWKQNLGTIYKDNSITTLGKEADVDLNLSEVSSIHANFKVDGKNYTSIVYIVDIEKGLIRIPFTREVLSIGMHELELVAVMKNGDVIPSQTFTYNIVESLDNLEDITEETNYPILIQLLQDVNSKIAEIDDAIARIPSPEELKGEKGDKGDKGEQGIQGERGLQGIQGIRGEKGDKGDRGLQGIQGVKGEKGDKGERGERGLQGIQGNQGARGIQGEKGDKGETGVGLGFEWSGTKLGIKKDTDTSYKYVELKGAKGEQGAKGEKGDTPSIAHLEQQISDKSKELDTKFNTLTAKQQQDAEVITARDGEVSLNARLERDLAKGKIHFVDVEGSNVSTESEEGYLENVEILGNTWQDANNLSDIRSVGTKVEGQELYEIPVLSTGKNSVEYVEAGDILTSNGTDLNSVLVNRTSYIPVKSDVSYVFSDNNINGSEWYALFYYDINKQFIKYDHSNKFVSTINGYVRIKKHNPNQLEWKPQLEEGTVATPYEPYIEDKLTILSPTPLEKVGDVADRIVCKDGVWGVEKNIASFNFNGTESWHNGNYPTTNHISYRVIMPSRLKYTTQYDTKFICSFNGGKLAWFDIYSSRKDVQGAGYGDNGYFYIRVPNSKTLETFKQDLSNNPVRVLGLIEQPQFIPLPHEQQVKLRTFADRTNISFLTEIEGAIKAQVPKSLGATVNTHTSQIDNLNKELDRVKKLEESTVSTVTSDKAFTTIAETNQGYFEDVKVEGKTLVNLLGENVNKTFTNIDRNLVVSISKDLLVGKEYTLYLQGNSVNSYGVFISIKFKDGTEHIVSNRVVNNNVCTKFMLSKSKEVLNLNIAGWSSNATDSSWSVHSAIILEGDHTDKDITFFEGLKSVGQDSDEISVLSVNENLFNHKLLTKNDNNYINEIEINDNIVKWTATGSFDWYGYNMQPLPYDCYLSLNAISSSSSGESSKLAIITDVQKRFVANGQLIKVFIPKGSTTRIRAIGSTMTLTNICISTKDINIDKKQDKKQILYYNPTTQTWEKPVLREWDSIEKRGDKYYYHKRSEEVVLNGSENWHHPVSQDGDNTILLYSRISDSKINQNYPICDMFSGTYLNIWEPTTDIEGILINHNKDCILRLNKAKLPTQDVEGFKAWLQANNVTVVYQLAKEEVYECTNLDLITYQNETNLIVNSGAIQPRITLKVLSNVSNVVKLLQEKVSILENKFIEGLKQVLAGDMMSLAHLLYPEDFENNHEIQTLEL